MASKLRRAPLFGIDNPLRIPTLPKYSSSNNPATGNGNSGFKFPPKVTLNQTNRTPTSNTTTITSTTSSSSSSSSSYTSTMLALDKKSTKNPPKQTPIINRLLQPKVNSSSSSSKEASKPHLSAAAQLKVNTSRSSKSNMEVGVAYTNQQRGGRMGGSAPDTGRGSPKTSLHVDFQAPGELKERKEKYLTAKYGAHQMALIRKRLGVEMWMFDQLQILYPPKNEGKNEEKEVDLDELLDLEDDMKRRQFLKTHLSDCSYSQEKVNNFIDELMERAKIL